MSLAYKFGLALSFNKSVFHEEGDDHVEES